MVAFGLVLAACTNLERQRSAGTAAANEAAGSEAPAEAQDPVDTAVGKEVEEADSGAEVHLSCEGEDRVRDDLAVPTLDGHALSAFVDRPTGTPCPLPTILVQTPYNKEEAYESILGVDRSDRPLFASPHYNYVVVDWRGRFGSSGVPIDDGTWLAQDGYSTVEWIAEQPWSDGQVAMWGVSALCGQQYRTAIGPKPTSAHPDRNDGPPPSLQAMVPIMCPIRTDYERAYPGGVLRHEWASALDVLGFGLRTVYENNPRSNLLWTIAGGEDRIENIAVPALVVGGLWDVVPTATVEAFNELVGESDPSVRDQHRLLMGPWIHFATGGEINSGAARPLTDDERVFLDLGRRIDADTLAFFDHHLLGAENEASSWQAVRYFQSGEGWTGADSWPPADSETNSFYAAAGSALTTSRPTTASTADIPYDADDPSPTIGGATLSPYNCMGSETPLICTLTPNPETILAHGPASQAQVVARADGVLFVTEPVSSPLPLTGNGTAYVDVSTTLEDADVAVRVVDVAPDGTPLLIGEGIARISSWADPSRRLPVAPGTRTSVEVPLNAPLGYTIAPGHQLGLILTGSNWPLYARNPGTGAVFHEDDVATGTKPEFTWGLPAQTIDLQSPGSSGTLTFHLDGATRLEVGVGAGS